MQTGSDHRSSEVSGEIFRGGVSGKVTHGGGPRTRRPAALSGGVDSHRPARLGRRGRRRAHVAQLCRNLGAPAGERGSEPIHARPADPVAGPHDPADTADRADTAPQRARRCTWHRHHHSSRVRWELHRQ